jgi:hypothetical protein
MLALRLLVLTVFFLIQLFSFSQDKVQVVRGTVKDNISESPIPGAKISILSVEPVLRVLSDHEGNFRIPTVPIGTHLILVTYSGYEDVALKGVIVDAGKETVLNILLTEKVQQNEEVTVSANRDTPINEMSVVSTKTFSVEETQKFAGAMNDPARMATSFAGVINTAGFNNDISIRGNSPRGMIWRMEGVEIPNPNHFSSAGTSGGGISIISSQLMGTSDFATGAFAAEYGNALSGVFDLGLRKGNNEKREYTLQTSVIGLDAAIEGPFKKGYGGSYLVNYRYSTLDLMTKIIPFRDNLTRFQDLSFNLYLPTKKIGNFGMFGFAGKSSDTYVALKDSLKWEEEPQRRYAGVFEANSFVFGLWHKVRITDKSYLKTNAAFSGAVNGYFNDSLDLSYEAHRTFNERFLQTRATFSSTFVQKISSKTNFRAGVLYNLIGFEFDLQQLSDGMIEDKINEEGSTSTVQSFVQLGHKFTDRFTTNIGVHYLQLLLNNSWNIEPRASMSYKLNTRNSLSFGYGLHSQTQPLGTYFARIIDGSGNLTLPNEQLELSKAHHLVLSYNFVVNENHRLRAEAYFQHLLNLPVGINDDSTYSLLNSAGGYDAFSLVSEGIGRNYGLEFTFERTIAKEFYYLISTSLYDSKYRALNGNWYNTRYNTSYIFNVTGGKEWTLKNPEKIRIFSFNLKSTLAGGMRFTNLDLNDPDQNGFPQLDHANSFGEKMPAYYKLDIRLGLKRNYKKATGMVYVDVMNALNNKNPAGQYFDVETGEVKYFYHFGIMPVFGYRLTF